MTDIIEIEGGEVTANLADRTITGRLLPFGEEGRTNVGRFTVEAGSVALPADPAIISLNIDHKPSGNVGRAHRVWQQPDGIYASWTIANTPEGDAALADALNPGGIRRRLSGEFGPAIIRAGKLVAGHAKLWGSALVPMGAFPGAMVLAADTPDGGEDLDSTLGPGQDGHLSVLSTDLPTDITVSTPEGEQATYTPEAAPAEDNPQEGGSIVTATATDVLAGASTPAAPVPPTLAPSAPAATTTMRLDRSARQVLAAIAAYKANPQDGDALQVLAALSDITISGNGSLPTGANGTPSVIPPNWVGQYYQGEEYAREYITLCKLGTDITATGKSGYGLHRRTATTGTTEMALTPSGGTWAGNKVEVPSHSGFSAAKTSTLRRFARANDFAREWWDLPGGEAVVEAFIRLLVEEHQYWSDQNALLDIITAAGAPVAPATASYPTDYPEALGMLIQGILAVKARKANTQRRDVPTFAIANELAYAELVYATGGDQNLPAFVNIAVSTNGNGTVDGAVQVVQGATGIEDTASVIVGDRRAIEFDELPGGPLQIDALELAKGGIDRAVHGYLQTFSVRPEAVVLVGTADV